MDLIKQRVITTPNTFEIIEFKDAKWKVNHVVRNKDGRKGSTIHELEQALQEEKRKEYRIRTLARASSSLWRTHQANANQYKEKDKFLTLTTKEAITDIDAMDYQFKKFIQRLKRNTKTKIQYQAVRELQERQAIHYHVIIYGMPFVPHSTLLELWNKDNPYTSKKKLSGVNIKAIADGLEEMTNYLTSYQLKDLIEKGDWLLGRKTILASKDLKKPDVMEYPDEAIKPLPHQIKKGITFLDSNVTYYRLK